MFMVLLLHADFHALGAPLCIDDISSSPFISTIKVSLEMASIVAVNVFILNLVILELNQRLKVFLSSFFNGCFFRLAFM